MCPHSGKPCVNNWVCEFCKVPNAFGYFMYLDKRGTIKWEQRFILEHHRKELVDSYNKQIAELEILRDEVLKIPSKKDTQ